MANFRPIHRAMPYLRPALSGRLAAQGPPGALRGRHCRSARCVGAYPAVPRHGLGPPYHPTVMLGLLVYGCATGVYSSRRIEAATYDSIAFRNIAANQQPDHDSLGPFRRRFLPELTTLSVKVLGIARQMKLLKLGTIALEGTKVHGNASRHSALSYGHAEKIKAQLEVEVKERLARAEAADQEPLPEGLSLPAELARREERLAAIQQAKTQIEASAAERDAREKADFDAKIKPREQKTARSGKKPGGKPPAPPTPSGASNRPDQPHR